MSSWVARANQMRWLRVTQLALLGALALTYAFVLAHNVRPLTVLTGSMRPTLPPGSVVLDEGVKASSVQVGDVITFHPPGAHSVVTHRIVAISSRPSGSREATTRGDANNIDDPWRVKLTGTVWRERAHIPAIGWAGQWLRNALPVNLVTLAVAMTAVVVLIQIWRKPANDGRGNAHAA